MDSLAFRMRLRALYVLVGVKRTALKWLWDLGRRLDGSPAPDPQVVAKLTAEKALIAEFAGPLSVEPKYGWAISGRTLHPSSITFGNDIETWTGREWIGLPSPRWRAGEELAVVFDEAVSLCSPWPENYYHFITDVLPKVQLLIDEGRIDASMPFLVKAELFELTFFQEAIRCGRLADLSWVPVGSGGHIDVTGRLVVPHGGGLGEANFAGLRDTLDIGSLPAGTHPERVFITRAPERGRVPNEREAVEQIFRDHGFVVVDLDGVSFGEQLGIFSNARCISGIHGAAFANLIWATPGDVRVLELVPKVDDESFDWFQKLSAVLGLDYERVLCGKNPLPHKRASFDVDLDELTAAVERTVAALEQPA